MRWFSLLLVGVVVVGCKSGEQAVVKPGSASGSAVVVPTIPPDAPATNAAKTVPGIELAEVASTGYDDAATVTAVIAVSPTTITVEGKAVVPIVNDAVDPSELEGGAMGMRIPKLAVLLEQLTSDTLPKRLRSPVAVAVDRRLPFKLLVQILFTASRLETLALSGRFVFLAQSGSRTVAIPIALPQPKPAGVDERRAADTSVRPIVSITKDRVLLWSLTGLEGTLREPLKQWPRTSPSLSKDLADALAAIVTKRWPDDAKRDDDRVIVLQADPGTSVQMLAELFGTVRATPDGKRLFDEIQLSSGFE